MEATSPQPIEIGTCPEGRKAARQWRNNLRQIHPLPNGRRVDDAKQDVVASRDGSKSGLGNLYWGGSAFLLLGGPSALELDLTRLSGRGCIVMSINNAATTIRPHLWTHGDPPVKFCDSIWRDPGIIKFVPKAKLWCEIRERKEDGSIGPAGEQVRYMPGVVSYERNTWFSPERFLSESTVNFGNSKKHADNPHPKVLSTMFSALRLLHWLGFFRVFLVGADFDMQAGRAYHFNEVKSSGAVQSNNIDYRKVAHLLHMLQPKFLEAGYEVYNCNPTSRLEVFPYVSYDDAIESCTSRIEQEPVALGFDKK